MLIKETEGVLVGQVTRGQSANTFQSTLRIVVPALNNYAYGILMIQHTIALYPLTLQFLPTGTSWSMPDEMPFIAKLRELLRSTHVRAAITGLLAQIQADAESSRAGFHGRS